MKIKQIRWNHITVILVILLSMLMFAPYGCRVFDDKPDETVLSEIVPKYPAPSSQTDSVEIESNNEKANQNTSDEGSFQPLTLDQLREKFPHRRYWNHYSGEENNPDGYTITPCTHNKRDVCECNEFFYSSQCYGFVAKITYDYYGISMRKWPWNKDIDKLKAGDVLLLKNVGLYRSNHPMWLTDVNTEVITFVDCNSHSDCVICWNQTMRMEEVMKYEFAIYVAPHRLKEATMDTDTGDHHVVDKSYPTGFPAKMKYETPVFECHHRNYGRLCLRKGAECTVNEVYTDGCCKVTYRGKTKVKTYYCFFNDVDPVYVVMAKVSSVSEQILAHKVTVEDHFVFQPHTVLL